MIRNYLIAGAVAALLYSYYATYQFGKKVSDDENKIIIQNAMLAQAEAEKKYEIEKGKINVQVITQYVDKLKVIEKIKPVEVTKWVSDKDDSACKINKGFVNFHNSIAEAKVPELLPTDREPSSVLLSNVGNVVKENYTSCHETRAQLESLQNWVTEQEKIWNKSK